MAKRSRIEIKGKNVELLRELMFKKKIETKSKMLEEIMVDIANGKYDNMADKNSEILSISLDGEKTLTAREHAKEVGLPNLRKLVPMILESELEQTQESEVEQPLEEKETQKQKDKQDDDDLFVRKKDRLI